MNKLLQRLAYATLIFVALFMVFVGWQLFAPFNPGIVDQPIKLLNKNVAKGEPVVLLITSCTEVETTVDLDFELLAGEGNQTAIKLFSLVDIPTQKECQIDAPIPVDLDKSNLALPSGTYKIRLRTVYTVNSFRTIEVNYDSEPFNYISED